MFVPGHQAHLSPLARIESPSPALNHLLILALIPFQSHRAQGQTLIAHDRAQENVMTSVDGHEAAASHANPLMAVIAVIVQVVDAC